MSLTDKSLAAPNAAADPTTIDSQLADLQARITALSDELETLRRRDQTVNLYMRQVDEEMRLAARLQQDFLPKSLPQVGRIKFQTLFRPAGYVSGDLYDVMRLDETHVGFYMADAVGHGMPAALLTMFIKNALDTKEIVPDGYRLLSPGETISRLNDALVAQNLSNATFATAIYGTIDTSTLQAQFARGGHPNPIVLRGDGTTFCPEVDGGLLGIFEGEKYATTSFELFAGDRLFVFSDGIEVAFASDLNFDTQQWKSELERRRNLSTEELVQSLAAHLDSESGSLLPKDDLTIIVAEVS